MKRKLGTLIVTGVFCLCFSNDAQAQLPEVLANINSEADSLAGERAFAEAIDIKKKLVRRVMSVDSLPEEVVKLQNEIAFYCRRQGDYRSSLQYTREAIQYGEKYCPEAFMSLSNAYNALGIYYYVQSQPLKALAAYERTYQLRLKDFGREHPNVADVLNNMGICYEQMADYGKALDSYEEALDIRFNYFGDCHPRVADSYLNIGTCWHKWGDFTRALRYYDQARTIYEADITEYGADLVLVLNNMGVCYQDRGDFMAAEKLLEATLEIQLQLHPPDHPEVATSLNNLGLNFFDLGDYNKALIFFRRALDIRETSLAPGHPKIASLRNHMASCFLKKKDYERAYKLAREALKMRLDHFGRMNRDVADSYSDIGLYFESRMEFDSAEANYRSALEIYINQLGKDHPKVADIWVRLGNSFYNQKKFAEAKSYYEEAVRIKSLLVGTKHPEVSRIIAHIARCMPENPEAGLALLDKQLGNEQFLLDPEIAGSGFTPLVALEILTAKSDLLQQLQSAQPNDSLYAAIRQVHDAGLHWMDRALRSYQEPGSKQLLMDRFYYLLERILVNCEQAFAQTNDQAWIERAFVVSEQGKSLLLREAVANLNTESFAGIPDSLRRQEEDLKLDIAGLERRLFLSADSLRENINRELFAAKQTQYNLINRLRKEYPEYYKLRYGNQSIDLAAIRKYVAKEEMNILEYFQGDDAVYVFLLNADTLWMQRLGGGSETAFAISSFRKELTAFNPIDMQSQELANKYGGQAHALYKLLIEPVEEQFLGNRLLIIPDGSMHYLPFDCLLGQPVGSEAKWRNLPFLLRDFSIGYAYTAELLLRPPAGQSAISGEVLAMAPSFSGVGELAPLKYNAEEIESVSAAWPARVLLGSAATKSQFQKEAPLHRLLHLATHAEANDTIGSYSFLAFQGGDTDVDTARLFARELFSMRLPADLVVLSACETGVGEWQRGEGMISLARGFFYSGARSLLTSLWKLDDRSSSRLMANFYDRLEQGESKDVALQQAKLDFIRESSSIQAHPFYWASYVPVGVMDPIPAPTQSKFPYWIFSGLIGLGLIGYIIWLARK
ncbi:MAG: CHAT domain-containing protein [Bacteroidetes bacterium]|nr:CHAT domain-containing protein [Bacteroidota bacterium]